MLELNRIHCFNVLSVPAEKIFRIQDVKVTLPSYSRILGSRVCPVCGEKYMETKAVKEGDELLCAGCAGGGYGQLDWSGIHIVKRDAH